MPPVSEEIRKKRFNCPTCGEPLDPVDLLRPAGLGGGTLCPKCLDRVVVSFPYSKIVVVISLVLAIGAMLVMRVRSVPWFLVGTVVLWVPISLWLNVYSTRFKNPVLKKWEPRKRKTFFEWLHERDQIRAPEIGDAKKEP